MLLEPTANNVSPIRQRLHDNVLSRLRQIGPLYPEDFRMIMTQNPVLRSKLEGAIRIMTSNAESASAALESINKANIPKAPTITLKTSFTNFTG